MKTLSELKDKYGKLIEEAATLYNLDECILAGLVWQESRGNPAAISSCGAIGLTQVMPNTAKDRKYSLVTPRGQIFAGADYLFWLLKNFAAGDISDALGGYNAGPARIKGKRYLKIKETREYVPRVLKYAEEYRKLITPPDVVSPIEVKAANPANPAKKSRGPDWR